MAEVVTVGHILTDIRIMTDEFATPDRESHVIEMSYGPGGSAANSAVAAKFLGKSSAVMAKVGMDNFGRMALEEIMRYGVDITGVRIKVGGRTGFTLIIINRKGEIEMYGYKGVSEEFFPEDVDLKLLKDAKHLHVASLRLDTTRWILKEAKKTEISTTFDPGRRLARLGIEEFRPILPYVDYLLINFEEFRMLTGTSNLEDGISILQKAGASGIVVKRGSKGVIFVKGKKKVELPAFEVEVVDTTGAGDAFAAGFFVALLDGFSEEDAIKFGNAVAALKVTKLGAQFTYTKEDVLEFLASRGINLES